jgi:hypothetical protein
MNHGKEFVQYLLDIGFDLNQVKAALENGSWQAEAGMSAEEQGEAYRSVLSIIAEVNKNIH